MTKARYKVNNILLIDTDSDFIRVTITDVGNFEAVEKESVRK